MFLKLFFLLFFQTLSLPVIVTVHGKQASAMSQTKIQWHRAFGLLVGDFSTFSLFVKQK
jgi:hypothetical protein